MNMNKHQQLLNDLDVCLRAPSVDNHDLLFNRGLLQQVRNELAGSVDSPRQSMPSMASLYLSIPGLERAAISIDPYAVERAILEFTQPGDTICNPFGGCGTVPMVASLLGRHCITYEIDPKFTSMIHRNMDRLLGKLSVSEDEVRLGRVVLCNVNAAVLDHPEHWWMASRPPIKLVLFGPPEARSPAWAQSFTRALAQVLIPGEHRLSHPAEIPCPVDPRVVMFYGVRGMQFGTFANWVEGFRPWFYPLDCTMRTITDQDGDSLCEFRVVWRLDHLAVRGYNAPTTVWNDRQ